MIVLAALVTSLVASTVLAFFAIRETIREGNRQS